MNDPAAGGFSNLGRRVPRVQGYGSTTSEGNYVSNLSLPGMVFVKSLRSPFPRARVKSIDATRAEKLPGVVKILHRHNLPAEYQDFVVDRGPPERRLFNEVVFQVGMVVAIVAAESEHIADDALELIQVEYESLPAALDYLEAMNADTPKQWDNPYDGTIRRILEPVMLGDPDTAMRDADVVTESTTVTPYQQNAAMELRTMLFQWDSDDNLLAYIVTAGPFSCRDALANIFNLPQNKVRVIQTGFTGGSFGTAGPELENFFLPAVMARLIGRPVKAMHSRYEDLVTAGHRSRTRATVRLGAKHDGTALAVQFNVVQDMGARGDRWYGGVRGAWYLFQTMYSYPHQKYEGVEVFTNSLINGQMRGVSRQYALLALETAMDRTAYTIQLDPLDFRLKNLNEKGHPLGLPYSNPGGQRETLLKAADAIGWREKWHPPGAREVRPGVFHGIAIVSCSDRGGGDPKLPSTGQVVLNTDGTLQVISGSSDLGQGQRTLMSMLAAETLGIPLEQTTITAAVDTAATTDTAATAGSWQMVNAGWGIVEAATDARRQLLERAAGKFTGDARQRNGASSGVVSASKPGDRQPGDGRQQDEDLDVTAEDLDVQGGFVFLKSDPAHRFPVRDAVRFQGSVPVPNGRGGFTFMGAATGAPIFGKGDHQADIRWERVCFNAHAAEVEVDTAVGEVRVTRYVAAQDVGKILNLLALEQQNEGGAVYGLGSALSEEMVVDMRTGLPLNANFLDYKVPSILDAPRIENLFVEVPQDYGPFGATAIGQASTPPPAPLLVNAVYNAIGVWIEEIPLTRMRVLDAVANMPGPMRSFELHEPTSVASALTDLSRLGLNYP